MASLSNINGLFDVHSTGAILFSTSHGTTGQILRSNGNAAPTWVAASTVIGGPYVPIAGDVTINGYITLAAGKILTVGGNLFVTGTSTLTGALSGTTGAFSGLLTVNYTGDYQIMLSSPSTWCGIGFNDSQSVDEYLWYNGAYGTFALGGGGSSVVNKRLHVDGGMTIGVNYDATAVSSNSLNVQGSVTGTVARFDTLNNNANSANIIYRSGTDTIVGNNANALVVEDGGDVGIGVIAPARILEVSSGTAALVRISATDTSPGYSAVEFRTNGSNYAYVGTEGGTGGQLFIGTTAFATILGNTGAVPIQFATNNNVRATITDYGSLVVNNTPGTNVNWGRIQCGGTITVGNSSGTYNAHGRISGDSTSGLRLIGSKSGTYTTTMGITIASYNVGINTIAPAATLHVDANGGGVLRISRLSASTTNYMQFENDGTNGTIRTEGATIFRAGGSAERMVIDSSGNVKLAITNATSSTTIGKDGGGMWMETAGSTNALSDMRFQARASGAGSYSAIKIKPSNQSLEFQTSNTVRMLIDSSGNVGINDTGPDHTLSVGGTAKISSGLLVGSMTLITNFTAPYFTHLTADLNVDLVLGNTPFWGHLEVTITGTYSNQNTPGKLTKIYAVGLNLNGTIYTNVSRVSDAMGPVVTQINLGEVRWDSTTSTYRIRIAHIASTGNQYWIQVKGFTASGLAESTLPDLGISALYTQSTTGLLAQIPSFKTEMATFSAATGSTSGIISANSGYITSFSNSATHASSNSALFVPVANGIKITQAGLIQVTLTQDFISTSSASYASVSIRKNAGVIAYSLRTNSNSQWDMFNSTTTMQVAANDEIGFHYQAGDFTSMDTGSWSQYSFIWTSL
jgi:hypothetical protein